jgi:UDP-N-acetylglucosamine 2-epimerase (non-hydrolysing)
MTVVHLVTAARPNFMKVAPLYQALRRSGWAVPLVVHTGQHFSPNMSDSLIGELGLPAPHHHLGVAAPTHGRQVGETLIAYEELLMETPPDWVVVVGDVDSTVAAALAARKLAIPTAHLEAGLRSFDRSMPEEINRIVTDAVCDLLWTHCSDADENLRREGIPAARIERVGNVMIDCFEMMRPRIEAADAPGRFGLHALSYAVVTLHRPANVDQAGTLTAIVDALAGVAGDVPLIFPVHQRTHQRLEKSGLMDRLRKAGVQLTGPLGYVDFMSLVLHAGVVVTDSGGIQEETTYLGIPCLTLRESTERPITITQGSNRLVRPPMLKAEIGRALSSKRQRPPAIELWDGRAADRVVAALARMQDRA